MRASGIAITSGPPAGPSLTGAGSPGMAIGTLPTTIPRASLRHASSLFQPFGCARRVQNIGPEIAPGSLTSRKSSRLSRGRERGLPDRTFGIELLDVGNDQVGRHMNEYVMEEADHQSRLSGHRGVYRLAGELIA